MTQSEIHLDLSAGASLPTSTSWMLKDGHLRLSSGNEADGTTTLGICGPGDLVIPSMFSDRRVRLSCLSRREMNLTHRKLAEMTGLTRVTVTMALIRLHHVQCLCKQGGDEPRRLGSRR